MTFWVDELLIDHALVTRARLHSALGEPVRLAIVDNLVLGDASPGELGRIVALPTNLLAHHLKVLEEAGLIRRVRSEGDRRRSYVQLRWDDVAVAALLNGSPPGSVSVAMTGQGVWAGQGTGAARVPRVVFVCTHNSARSQLAAAAWARVSAIPAISAGTRPAERVHPRAVTVARHHGLRLSRSGPRRVADTVRPDDLVVAVCDNAHEELVAASGRRTWLHWAVADPVRLDTEAAFEAAFTDLTHHVGRLAQTLHRADHCG